MASTSDASIDDILDDIQLNQVILQSLDDQRPNAVAERQEIVDTIKELETRLAELRGDVGVPPNRPPSSSAHHPQDPANSDLLASQLDGPSHSTPFGSSRIPQWGQQSSAMSPPPRPSRPAQIDSSPSGGPTPTRKRQRNYDDYGDDEETDGTDDLEPPPAKRIPPATHHHSFPSSPSVASFAGGDELDDASGGGSSGDELWKILGLDSRSDLEAATNEQRIAEQWLEDRKEQERRDEEFARSLMGNFQEPSRPSSARSSSSTHYSGASLPMPTSPAPRMMDQRDIHRSPNPSSGFMSARNLPAPRFGVSSMSGMNNHGPERHQVTTIQDSDDSDLAEISAGDFQRHVPRPNFPRDHHAHSRPTNGFSNVLPAPSWLRNLPDRPISFPSTYSALGGLPGPSGFNRGPPGAMYIPGAMHNNTMARLNAEKHMVESIGNSVFGDPYTPRGNQDFPGHYPAQMDPEWKVYSDLLNEQYEYGADPKKVNEEIKQLLEAIRPDSEISLENREGTPEALKLNLMEHQKLGLSWMKSLEEHESKGGILADDMGLGKTIQAIALMVSRQSEDPERKATLIIAPVALMQQWKREIQRILKPGKHQLSVYVLHGDKRSVAFRDLKNYDVVLTTFGTLSSELKRREKYDELHTSGAEAPSQTRELLKSMPCLGPASKWHRVIIDEAQCIKNRNTKAAMACCRINSTYRWCMSGTPMMNNVEELHSLLKFLRIKPYNALEKFNHDFTRPLKSGSTSAQAKAMRQLQVLLKAVLLRRTKESKIDGKPILQLPPRVSEKVHAVFSEDEQALYNSLEARSQLQFNRYLEAGTVGRNYSNILVLLLRLRQACCHPHLIKDYSVKINENTDELDLVANARELGNDVVIRLKENNDLECPICIDAVENPIIFFPCGHSTCAECFSRMSEPSLAVRQGVDGLMEIKCPNCRGKVDPKRVTDHVSFKRVHCPDESDESAEVEPLKPAEDEDESDDDSDDAESLSRFIVNDDDYNEGSSRKSKGKGKGRGKAPKKKTLAELKKESSKNQKSKRKYLRRLEKTWVTSAKIDKAVEILEGVHAREGNEKTIIFSQFTALLDLLEVPIMRRGWGYRRYDGSMKPADRNTAVLDFTDNPDCRVMLVSLKAGNSGLNLVAASQVIIFDPFWNPYIEEQAIDRAHRIGQEREVQIHRILVQQTVEDRILELQDKKRDLIEGALDENASKNVSRLGTRELAYLFGVQ